MHLFRNKSVQVLTPYAPDKPVHFLQCPDLSLPDFDVSVQKYKYPDLTKFIGLIRLTHPTKMDTLLSVLISRCPTLTVSDFVAVRL